MLNGIPGVNEYISLGKCPSAKENDRKPYFVLLYVSWTLDFVTWMLFVVHVDDGKVMVGGLGYLGSTEG